MQITGERQRCFVPERNFSLVSVEEGLTLGEGEGELYSPLEAVGELRSLGRLANVELFGQLDSVGLSDGLVLMSRVYSANPQLSVP